MLGQWITFNFWGWLRLKLQLEKKRCGPDKGWGVISQNGTPVHGVDS